MRVGSAALVLPAIAAIALAVAPSEALEVVDYHPRLFISPSDLPQMRARAGIVDGTNTFDYPNDWEAFMDEYDNLIGEIDEFTDEFVNEDGRQLVLSTGEFWTVPNSRKYSEVMGNLATAYLLNAETSAGDPFKDLAVEMWGLILDDSRDRNGGSIGQAISMNYYAKNSNYVGFCMAYDYLYGVLGSENPTLRNEIAQWLFVHTLQGHEYISGTIENIDHYYLASWVSDGVFGTLLTLTGDPAVDQSQVASMLDNAHEVKQYSYNTRALNYCGTYSGYRNERIEEDVHTALIWASTTDEDPFVTYSYHFMNLDDWVMHMCRPNFHESDETGHSHDLHSLRAQWVHFSYPAAIRDENPYTLWFLDQAQDFVGYTDKGWVNIFFNDKSIPRQQPTRFSYPLARYFGDGSFEDGHNSQYTHFRSAWSFDSDESSTVHASYLCGSYLSGHDVLSQGHLAIFRGSDILSASTGLYDGTNMPHTQYWHQAPISENTILVADPLNVYAQDVDDSVRVVYHTEGMQAHAPNTTGGGGFTEAEGPFTYQYISGFVDRFTNLDNGDGYLHSDITSAYPNTPKADLWPAYQTVDNVTRQITFQHGNYFVLLDRVKSTNPDAKKRVLMHNPDLSGYTLLDGEWNGGVEPHPIQYGGTPGQSTDNAMRYTWQRGSSKAFATVLYPRPAELGGHGRKLVRVGGLSATGERNGSGNGSDPSYEFWMRELETTYRWTSQFIGQAEEDRNYDNGWAGYWRMEIETTGRNEDTFLHVYEVTDTGQSAPTPIDYLEEVDAGHVGCAIDDPRGRRVNVFSRDEEADTGVYYRSSLEGPIDHLVTDLIAGVYLVELLDAEESFTVSVAEDLHVASFQTDDGGRVRLSLLSDLASGR